MHQETLKIPRHVGYIIDGNRRWARAHGLPAYEGHLAGYNTLKDILHATAGHGVSYISIFGFSTENWKRGEGETAKIMKLALRLFKSDIHELVEENIRLRVLGTVKGLSENIIKAARAAEAKTAHCTRATLAICFNYGGHQEILDAARAIAQTNHNSEDLSEVQLADNLYAPDIPALDMIVRTSGEQRLSGFMLWRAAYSELMFFDKFWPDMEESDVTHIMVEYARRNRRYGQ